VTLDRREFLRVAGTGLLVAGSSTELAAASRAPALLQGSPEVVVIGAGAFGGWTAFHLRRMGARVTLVDAYGPGNSRATSGDETRGVRSSYGPHRHADLWVPWARQAMERWKQFDAEFGAAMKVRLFFPTGDLIFREREDPIITRSREQWERLRVPHAMLNVDDVRREYPVFNLDKITFVLHEPDAGVVRARRACEVVAEAFRQAEGEVVMGMATPGAREGSQLRSIELSGPAATLRAGTFVFALGPWFPKCFPEFMADRILTPLGHVHYFGTPPGDDRFTFPNLPSYNFPGVTGWPALPPDNRGFRVRMEGDRLFDPDTSDRAFARSKDKPARQLLKERFPLLQQAPLLETRACHYEFSRTGNFIVDRHPQFENVWLAGGGSAEGFKFGPVIGEYVAKRVLGDQGDPVIAQSMALRLNEQLPQRRRG
jgi:glycine/D-amino acid oxidase-like deaminating enzyme